jgi:uncharacterized protein
MNNQVREIQLRAVLPIEGNFAIFLGDATKTFVIYIDESVGKIIAMGMRGMKDRRPLTHDLMSSVLLAFGAKVQRVIINEVHGAVFHARLILTAENELHAKKVIELDARPSDSIALALRDQAPLFVTQQVWDNVEDVSDSLADIESSMKKQSLSQEQLDELAALEAMEEEFEKEAAEDAAMFDLDEDDEEDDSDEDEDDDEDDGFGVVENPIEISADILDLIDQASKMKLDDDEEDKDDIPF